VLLFAVAVRLPCRAADEPPGRTLELSTVRTASGRFAVFGADRAAGLHLLRWVRDTADRVERTLGRRMRTEGRSLHVILRRSAGAEGGRVETERFTAAGTRIRELVIYNEPAVGRERMEEALCGLLLEDYVEDAGAEIGREVRRRAGSSVVPAWLASGVAQNLSASRRARNRDEVLARWHAGRAASPLVLFGEDESGPAGAEGGDRALCGMVTGWLLSRPDKSERLERMFRRLATGQAVSAEWLAAAVFGCASAAEMDEAWDRWLLVQERVVYEPGGVTPALVTRLKAEWLLSAGDSDSRLGRGGLRRIEPADWITVRGEPWAAKQCREKAARIQLLALGRSREFRRAAHACARFFRAVAEAKSQRSCRRLLAEAEEALEAVAPDGAAAGAAE